MFALGFRQFDKQHCSYTVCERHTDVGKSATVSTLLLNKYTSSLNYLMFIPNIYHLNSESIQLVCFCLEKEFPLKATFIFSVKHCLQFLTTLFHNIDEIYT